MLAKHKVGSSTLLTRSIFKPLIRQGLFFSGRVGGVIAFRGGLHEGCTFRSQLRQNRAAIRLFNVLAGILNEDGFLTIRDKAMLEVFLFGRAGRE
jgi:hypothetical protein